MNEKLNEIISTVNAHHQHINEIIAFQKKLELKISLLQNITNSKSQFFQDLFVLSETNSKKNGFFVEFGATDGITGSNSYLLEKNFGWNGILAEPARCWKESLKNNRACHIDYRCVWGKSDTKVEFCETEAATLSTAAIFLDRDFHSSGRSEGTSSRYLVETISLNDLLEYYKAPNVIDYLSVDTEGSEFEILSNFNFKKYDVRIISVEHNWTEDRKRIHDLLVSEDYERKHLDLSDCDDWYVKRIST
jgi:FkbM family methyltransferase